VNYRLAIFILFCLKIIDLLMSTQRQTVDSSLALGRLEINSPMLNLGTCLSGSVKEKTAQGGSQAAHLNGCVPLSHQVAGHKYGVDKVGQ
jgi:hypothetical protein